MDDHPLTVEEGKKYIWKNTVWAALFIVWFALTVASTVPWLWLMSINAHWFSTMYSWYTFASTFVAGIALITLFVIYLKNKGYLEYVNKEHLHDLGKFQFAFSIFWTYLWFSQFMLIWYANIPEETTYFRPRFEGAYTGLFYLNLCHQFPGSAVDLYAGQFETQLYHCNLYVCSFAVWSLAGFLPDGFWKSGAGSCADESF